MRIFLLSRIMKKALIARFPVEARSVIRSIIRSILVGGVRSRIRKLERHCKTLGQYYDLLQDFEGPILPIDLSSGQMRNEILDLLGKGTELGLKSVAEIGTCRGGTFYLLCKASGRNASILTMDIDIPRWRKRLIRSFARIGQTPIIVKGDSHQQSTIDLMRKLLENQIDLLLIDGDHSYTGVKKDFINYSPLVRKGGWIAFHDIVPVKQKSKSGQVGGWTGGVPRFWNEVKREYKHFEIIDNPSQDGCGIGVIIQF